MQVVTIENIINKAITPINSPIRTLEIIENVFDLIPIVKLFHLRETVSVASILVPDKLIRVT